MPRRTTGHTTGRIAACALFALVLAISGCSEEPTTQPIVATGPRPSVTEQPSELIVNPHARLRERSDEERQREAERLGTAEGSSDNARPGRRGGGGGGGGGGRDNWHPSPADPPTRREVEQFQRELANEMDDAIDPEDDPCRQFADSMQATTTAGDRVTRDRTDLSRAQRRQLEQLCGTMPAAYRRCMDRAYFRAHVADCERSMARVNRRGQRHADTARAQLDAIERGSAPFPGQATASRAGDDEDDEEDDELDEEDE